MELAFINAILRSPAFPPHDPWLSGYAISYYYFGYVLVAMIARLAKYRQHCVQHRHRFDLQPVSACRLWVDLQSAACRYAPSGRQPVNTSAGAPLDHFSFCWSATWKDLLHALHNRGFFGSNRRAARVDTSFWKWLDIKDLISHPPLFPGSQTKFWWWWRASRVIEDYDLAGNAKEIIQEFPFFSFLLSDLHPHVLAIPFALLAVALSLHSLLDRRIEFILRVGPFKIDLTWQMLLFSSIALGAMGFLNTWDLPVYIALFAGCYATGRALQMSENNKAQIFSGWVKDFLFIGLITGILGILLYLPFYLGFSSQAGGLIINLIYPTRGAHLWVVFGGLIIFLVSYLGLLWFQLKKTSEVQTSIWKGLGAALALVLGLWLVSLLLGAIAMQNPELRGFYLSSLAAGNASELFISALIKRLTNPGGWLTLWVLLAQPALYS